MNGGGRRIDRGRRVPAPVPARWLAVYATHGLHLLPGAGHAETAVVSMEDAGAAAIAAVAAVVVRCAVEAVGAPSGPRLLLGAMAAVFGGATAGARSAGAPIR